MCVFVFELFFGARGRTRVLSLQYVLLGMVLSSLIGSSAVLAQQVIDGEHVVIPGDRAPDFAVGQTLKVGNTGEASLTVQDGAVVGNTVGYVGFLGSSLGEVTVTGENSVWNNGGHVHIGYIGSGSLTIADGGTVENDWGHIGYLGGGEAFVTGEGSAWINRGNFYVGHGGAGMLRIEDGGTVSNTIGQIGFNVGSFGTATVAGGLPGSAPANSWSETPVPGR